MDAFLLKILSGVVVGVANKFAASLSTRGRYAVRELPRLRRDKLERAVEKSIRTSDEIAAELERLQIGKDTIEAVLVSPEIAGVVRQLAALSLERLVRPPDESGEVEEIVEKDPATGEIIKKKRRKPKVDQREIQLRKEIADEFQLLLALQVGASPEEVAVLAHELLRALTNGVQTVVGKSSLFRSVRQLLLNRSVLIDAEVANLTKNVDALRRAQFASLAPLLEFEFRYRGQVASVERDIRLPDLHESRRVPIESIFVQPELRRTMDREERRQWRRSFERDPPASEIDLERGELLVEGAHSELVHRLHRVVVLGDPGGGKSTLAQKLAVDAATASVTPTEGSWATPILIRVRDYLRERPCAFIDFMKEQARSLYQLEVPEGAFEYLLLNNRAFLIFDGLDEVLEVSDREEVVRELEAFANAYPSIPVIVMSRLVGYNEAPLDHRQFDTVRLGEFDDDAVRDYVERWFALSSEEEEQLAVETFLVESAEAADIRANPMMLGLMCNLFRGEGSIPDNRPALYGKCATLLFHRWDARRGIRARRPSFEYHLQGAIENLAHELLQRGRGAALREDAVVTITADYLLGRLFEDRAEAEAAGLSFVEFCKGRAWVLTDAGFRRGVRLFGFTHQTFLEYFAAAHLGHVHENAADLVAALGPRIERQEWDLIAQMAVQVRAELSDVPDQILAAILQRAKERRADRRRRSNVLDFAARSLMFLVPSPAATRTVVREVLAFYTSEVSPDPPPLAMSGTARESVVAHLLDANAEIRSIVRSQMTETVAEYAQSAPSHRARCVANVPAIIESAVSSWRPGEKRDFWTAALEHVQAVAGVVPDPTVG